MKLSRGGSWAPSVVAGAPIPRPGGGAGKEGGRPGGGGLLSLRSGRINSAALPCGPGGGGGGAAGAAQLNLGGGGGGGGAPAGGVPAGPGDGPPWDCVPSILSSGAENSPGGGAEPASFPRLKAFGEVASVEGDQPVPVFRSVLGVIGLIETEFSSSSFDSFLASDCPNIKLSGGIEKGRPNGPLSSFLSLEEAPESVLPVLSLLSFPPRPCRLISVRGFASYIP